MKKFQSLAFDTPQVFDCRSEFLFRRSILMRLYSPIDCLIDWLIAGNGNVNRIEKLVLSRTGTGDLPILNPTR